MPGGGVTEANLGELLADTGCTEFHASARVAVDSKMRHREDEASGRSREIMNNYRMVPLVGCLVGVYSDL